MTGSIALSLAVKIVLKRQSLLKDARDLFYLPCLNTVNAEIRKFSWDQGFDPKLKKLIMDSWNEHVQEVESMRDLHFAQDPTPTVAKHPKPDGTVFVLMK